MTKIVLRAIWQEVRYGKTPTWMFLLVSLCFWWDTGQKLYDYITWDRPMAKCAERAQHSPTLVDTCVIQGLRVTVVSNGLHGHD